MDLLPHIVGSAGPVGMGWAIFLLPLLSFLILAFFGKRLPAGGQWIATGLFGLSAVLSGILFYQFWFGGRAEGGMLIEWFRFSFDGQLFRINVGMLLDRGSSLMLFLVTFIATLVHVFSQEYMKGDEKIHRYWAYLGLFAFAMLGIVLASGLLTMFIFWELVGLSSYLLIGFWHVNKGPARASMKAFILNRIGDVGFIIGIVLVLAATGTTEFVPLAKALAHPQEGLLDSELVNYAGFFLILGALAKSAQFPLQTWLPDAMEGPTPVSSLIHAATMVAAGVYLLLRIYPILPQAVLTLLIFIGLTTLIMAGLSAFKQTDIKRILAYSTIAQLGLMVMSIGIESPAASFLHLATHAFFKCGLFLVAGTIIHALHKVQHELGHEAAEGKFDVQDIRIMGGLRHKLPKTFLFFALFTASIAGIPLFSGFLSKEWILVDLANYLHLHFPDNWLLMFVAAGFAIAFMTSFYMVRMMLWVFFGKNALEKRVVAGGLSAPLISPAHAKLWIPMAILALFSLWLLWSPLPHDVYAGWFVSGEVLSDGSHGVNHWLVTGISLGWTLLGGSMAWFRWRRQMRLGYSDTRSFFGNLLFHHFYQDWLSSKVLAGLYLQFAKLTAWFDRTIVDGFVNAVAYGTAGSTSHRRSLAGALGWFDNKVIDGIVNRIASTVMQLGRAAVRLQPGKVQMYLFFTLVAVLLFVLYLIYFAA